MKVLTVILTYLLIHVLPGFMGVVSAQVDPAKLLIGRWEGQVDIQRQPERLLVINAVSPKDGGWVGQGRFSVPPGKGYKVTINISSQDGKLVLDFESGGKMNNPWHFTLVSDNHLEGTANFVYGHGTVDRAASLQKVDQK